MLTAAIVVALVGGLLVVDAHAQPQPQPTAPPTSAPLATPAPMPTQIPPPPPPPLPGASPQQSPVASPEASPGASPEASPETSPGASASPSSAPTVPPTPPPIVVDPPNAGVNPGATITLRVQSSFGAIAATVKDPQICSIIVDQNARTVLVTGRTIGVTTITVSDSRGLTRDVGIRVADNAGSVADEASLRITGQPATTAFIATQAVIAAIRQARTKPGATVVATSDDVTVPHPLDVDNRMDVDVPVIIQGDGFFTVQGTTHVHVENVAQPRIRPRSLLVSDFPETLRANGVLFTADLQRDVPSRFLYYHYNPAGQPDRRILLKAENRSNEPALVQFVSGSGDAEANEMEIGHISTQAFLVRLAQNEGTLITIPPNSTINLVDQLLPAKMTVSNLLQLRELDGAPLHLTLVAQNATDPTDGPVSGALLVGDVPHARGIYPIPEFFFDPTYEIGGPDLEIRIGQIPLPNLREGEALAGDYGVLAEITIRIVNNYPSAQHIALYASPRGGRATGTFLIDRVLVQAHALPVFSHYKLRQYTVPAHGYISTTIVTMPEGGSSYPLRLILAPDDGSVPPGAPGSPIY